MIRVFRGEAISSVPFGPDRPGSEHARIICTPTLVAGHERPQVTGVFQVTDVYKSQTSASHRRRVEDTRSRSFVEPYADYPTAHSQGSQAESFAIEVPRSDELPAATRRLPSCVHGDSQEA